MLLLYPDHYIWWCELYKDHIACNFLDIGLISQYIVRSKLIFHYPSITLILNVKTLIHV